MRKKQLLLVIMALLLTLPSFLVGVAETNNSTASPKEDKRSGQLASKDEVVYANLKATGEINELYIVNSLDVTEPGTVIDYGHYDSVKNLTDLSSIEQSKDMITIDAPKGKFYYQGNINNKLDLPWDVVITYMLDGKKIAPTELAGKSGHVEIVVETTANKKVNSLFYDNYLLQISIPLDSSIFTNIVAQDGMIVNAGKNKQVTFTVMPGKDGELKLGAIATNFELNGIDIAAIPSSMSIDVPDFDTEEMSTLAKAIQELNDGVKQLKAGVSDLNNGVSDLHDGSKLYKDGISELAGNSTKLTDASKKIDDALKTISDSLMNEEMDARSFQLLQENLHHIGTELTKMGDGLQLLSENYSKALQALNVAISSIPNYSLSEQELFSLKSSNADQGVIDKLLETYGAAQQVKGTYNVVKEAFNVADEKLKIIAPGLKSMGGGLLTISNNLSNSIEGLSGFVELQAGMLDLSSQYGDFHKGIVAYMDGVGQLSTLYGDLHSGIEQLSHGTVRLDKGVSDLKEGTSELARATKDLPDQMQEEMDKMIAEFDRSDFEPVSFVSEENNKINLVQFVLKTEKISLAKSDNANVQAKEEKKGFWARLKALFL